MSPADQIFDQAVAVAKAIHKAKEETIQALIRGGIPEKVARPIVDQVALDYVMRLPQ